MVFKKILITGSIEDIGGRPIEVRNIITALSKNNILRIFSTIPMTHNSVAIKDIDCDWSTLSKEIYKSNFIIKILSLLSKRVYKSALPAYLLVNNKWSRKLFNFRKLNSLLLKREINNSDAVIFCGVFESGFLKEIAVECKKMNKPLILRTTGTIKSIPINFKDFLNTISCILVHSKSNASLLEEFGVLSYKVIDQTTLIEESLTNLPIRITQSLKFGYLGRLSTEKGILELLSFFTEIDSELIVAGSGPLIQDVEKFASAKCQLIGEVNTENLHIFFSKIDVLIIPSLEEAGPLVGIEGMAAGKLILSTKVGAMEERLQNTLNDFWFNINDEYSFINAVSRIKDMKPDRIQEIRYINRAKYLEMYSMTSVSGQYVSIVKDVLLK